MVGLFTKNNLRYNIVNQLYSNLAANLSKSLHSYRTFTGYDFTAAFSRQWNVLPLNLLEKNVETLETNEYVIAAVFLKIEEFVKLIL